MLICILVEHYLPAARGSKGEMEEGIHIWVVAYRARDKEATYHKVTEYHNPRYNPFLPFPRVIKGRFVNSIRVCA